jgi:hypothetical protein
MCIKTDQTGREFGKYPIIALFWLSAGIAEDPYISSVLSDEYQDINFQQATAVSERFLPTH